MEGSLALLLLHAYKTGWLVAAPIGPVNLEIIRRSLKHGLLAGFLVGLGATIIDATYLLVFTAGLGALLQESTIISIVAYFLGGSLLLWLGVRATQEAWKYHREEKSNSTESFNEITQEAKSSRLYPHFLLGLAMTASNPMTLAFWSALSLDFVQYSMQMRLIASLMVLAGAFSWVCLLILMLGFARRYIGPRMFFLDTAAGGIFINYFGLRFFWRATILLLS